MTGPNHTTTTTFCQVYAAYTPLTVLKAVSALVYSGTVGCGGDELPIAECYETVPGAQ